MAWFAFLIFPLFFESCDYFHPKETVPSYIQVDTFSFQNAGPDSTGYPTQRITDVWLFVNNQTLGVYTLPTQKIPVIAEGKATISIQAGVFTDGIRKNRVYYPFYRSFETSTILEKEKTVKVTPHFSYSDRMKKPFTFYQDFESGDTGCIRGEVGTVNLERIFHPAGTNENLYGRRFIRMTTQTASDIIDFSNDVYVPLKTNGNPVYLEFDYKSTCPIQVGIKGLIGNVSPGSVADLVLNPREEWTKVYVSLSEETGLFNTESILQKKPARFRFFLKTIPEPGAGNSLSLDNLRLIN
jgi:hypothetical protein